MALVPFMQIFLNGKKKGFRCISSAPSDFDKKKQRVKLKYAYSKDYNLIIEKHWRYQQDRDSIPTWRRSIDIRKVDVRIPKPNVKN
jgi:hypothetical protein